MDKTSYIKFMEDKFSFANSTIIQIEKLVNFFDRDKSIPDRVRVDGILKMIIEYQENNNYLIKNIKPN